jgi:uncharacterized membrane protein YoaK (UPF0700 family)
MIDAYCYITTGVFADTQSGNIALLIFNLLSFNTNDIFRFLFPLLSFILGVYFSLFLMRFSRSKLLFVITIIPIFLTLTLINNTG